MSLNVSLENGNVRRLRRPLVLVLPGFRLTAVFFSAKDASVRFFSVFGRPGSSALMRSSQSLDWTFFTPPNERSPVRLAKLCTPGQCYWKHSKARITYINTSPDKDPPI